MATLISEDDGPTAYIKLIHTVIAEGHRRAPRNEKTRDLGLTVVEIANPLRAYPIGTGRGLSRRIAAAEAVQLIGAFSDPNLLGAAFKPYQESDGRFWAAYGDRIGYQLLEVVRKLKHDPHTRQAVITLWNPELDNAPFKNDYPCTLALTFSVSPESHLLDLDVIMRSNDVWLGTPYDWFQFTILQQTVATLIDYGVGVYRHTTLSTHIYEKDVVTALAKIHVTPEELSDDSFPAGLARESDDAIDVIRRCRQLPYGDGHYRNPEHWYRDALGIGGGAAYSRPSVVTRQL